MDEKRTVNNFDIMQRLDGLERRVDDRINEVHHQIDKLHGVMVRIAEQQKDIDHIREDLDTLNKRYIEETEHRVKALEIIHAGCQVGTLAKDIKGLWAAIGTFVFLFVGLATERWWGSK